jgi:hypothetical protein
MNDFVREQKSSVEGQSQWRGRRTLAFHTEPLGLRTGRAILGAEWPENRESKDWNLLYYKESIGKI